MLYEHQLVIRKAVYALENPAYINSSIWIKTYSYTVTQHLTIIKNINVNYIQIVIKAQLANPLSSV